MQHIVILTHQRCCIQRHLCSMTLHVDMIIFIVRVHELWSCGGDVHSLHIQTKTKTNNHCCTANVIMESDHL